MINDLWIAKRPNIWPIPRRVEIAKGITAGGPAFQQYHFRIRDDTTALNTSGGWYAAEDTNPPSAISTTATFRIRFCLDEYNNKTGSMTPTILVSRNSGGYVSMSQYVDAALSGQFADEDSCSTQLLSSGAAGTFYNAGKADELTGATSTISIGSKGQFFEVEFSLSMIYADVDDGDTLDFRVYDGISAITYGPTPRVIVDKAAPPPSELKALMLLGVGQ